MLQNGYAKVTEVALVSPIINKEVALVSPIINKETTAGMMAAMTKINASHQAAHIPPQGRYPVMGSASLNSTPDRW